MALKRAQVFKCNTCGNIVEIFQEGGGTLHCCGNPMELLSENTADPATQKHVPVIETVDGGIKVKVGSTAHPMEDKHFIQWIQVCCGDKSFCQFLKPGEAAEAEFPVKAEEVTAVREYCNLHGLWKN